ncbi:molybdate ABC transporter substrate-binding protein [Methanogenium organophilum]|uniref:Molybdate ABC transporter substrate-binding protein n=1 Tax=Methanogenium organophilum TaxID=2199 RepID=A0A9X9S4K8_METOG|nr:molybdate ABC transporter substrate-binding protein [Methanogenium organophilum]WAI01668.1 molybdate ABC transporter substrate-binding protein [Methanogenium organophilum]
MSRKYGIVCAIIAAFCLCMVCGCTSDAAPATDAVQISTEEKSLIVYSGAGLRDPMDEIAQVYEEKTGTEIKYTYSGSAQLLSQMELLQEGDCYMPGARAYIDSAAEKGYINNSEDVIYHVLAIAVEPGNPQNITCLKDLTEDGVKVAIGEPTGNAVGKATQKIYEKAGLWEELQDNIVVRSGTVNELLVYMNMKQADAAIIWEDLLDNSDIEHVDIPQEEGFIKVVPVGTLSFSDKPTEAQAFADFVASDEGKAIFVKHGFETYPSEKYGDA